MTASRTVILLCAIGFAIADRDVASVFEEFELMPDVVDQAPREVIKINYGDKIVDLGKELTPTEVKHMPDIHYNHEYDAFYTLIMTDPDAPSREDPSMREFLHWLVGNIPGEAICNGKVLAEFINSGPGEDTGLHRYTFLVYKQPAGEIEFDEQRLPNNSIEGRVGFSTNKFAAKYNLGDPIAGNLYQCQYDDYVPFLHAQLGI